MALYTSFYTRQLALRPEAIVGSEQREDVEKAVQTSVPRRTVDFAAPYLSWFKAGVPRCLQLQPGA